MEHPNAIYFGIAAYSWMTVMGIFFLNGAIRWESSRLAENWGVYKSRVFLGLLGAGSLLVGLLLTASKVQELLLR